MSKTPWKQLEDLRNEVAVINGRLRAIEIEERKLIQECRDWIYSGPRSKLTIAEMRIMNLLEDYPYILNKQLADKLNVSERTIKFHIGNMLAKFGVDCRAKLVAAGRKK